MANVVISIRETMASYLQHEIMHMFLYIQIDLQTKNHILLFK